MKRLMQTQLYRPPLYLADFNRSSSQRGNLTFHKRPLNEVKPTTRDCAPPGAPGLIARVVARAQLHRPGVLLVDRIARNDSAEAERLGVARIRRKLFSLDSRLL
jgi:hypothetical protein